LALVTKQLKRIEHPTEPDAWAVIRVPLSAGDLAGVHVDGTGIAVSLELMASVVKEWSYDAPVSPETVGNLDLDTFLWINQEITAASGIRSDEEKKDSDSPSSDSSELVEAGSPSTSPT